MKNEKDNILKEVEQAEKNQLESLRELEDALANRLNTKIPRNNGAEERLERARLRWEHEQVKAQLRVHKRNIGKLQEQRKQQLAAAEKICEETDVGALVQRIERALVKNPGKKNARVEQIIDRHYDKKFDYESPVQQAGDIQYLLNFTAMLRKGGMLKGGNKTVRLK